MNLAHALSFPRPLQRGARHLQSKVGQTRHGKTFGEMAKSCRRISPHSIKQALGGCTFQGSQPLNWVQCLGKKDSCIRMKLPRDLAGP